MGWDGRYTSKTPKTVCDEQNTYSNEHSTSRVLASTLVRFREYYAAVEVVIHATGERIVYADMTIVERRDGKVWTKSMSEDMGPCYHNCPARILDLLTETKDETAKEWREKCRYAAVRHAQTAKLKVGDKVTFRSAYAGATEWFVESVGSTVRFARRPGAMPHKLIGWKTRVASVEAAS